MDGGDWMTLQGVRDDAGVERSVGGVLTKQGYAGLAAPAMMSTLSVSAYNIADADAHQLGSVNTPVGFTLLMPADNAGAVFIGGDENSCLIELSPGASMTFQNLGNTSAVWVKGSVGDKVLVIAELMPA
jgi:hypothetical protein